MKSKKRADGPASPVGVYGVPSTGPAGPVCPEWLKYGPIERITGVLAFAGRFAGRRTSACSLVPSASVMYAWVHLEPGGGASAWAAAGKSRAAAARARRVRMVTETPDTPEACGLLVQRQRGEDHVGRDQRPALEGERLAVAGDLPDRERGHQQRADVDRRQRERQLVREQQRDQHERGIQERRDLRDGVLDDRDRKVGLALGRQHDPGEVLDGVAGDRDDDEAGKRLRDAERVDRRAQR